MKTPYKGRLNRSGAPNLSQAYLVAALSHRDVSQIQLAEYWAYHEKGLRLLCEHYGIQADQSPLATFMELTWRLAEDHVPYFRTRTPKARKWTLEAQARLVLDVRESQGKAKKYPQRFGSPTVRAACKRLVEECPKYRRWSPSSLETKYKEAIRDDYLVWQRSRIGDEEKFTEFLRRVVGD